MNVAAATITKKTTTHCRSEPGLIVEGGILPPFSCMIDAMLIVRPRILKDSCLLRVIDLRAISAITAKQSVHAAVSRTLLVLIQLLWNNRVFASSKVFQDCANPSESSWNNVSEFPTFDLGGSSNLPRRWVVWWQSLQRWLQQWNH